MLRKLSVVLVVLITAMAVQAASISMTGLSGAEHWSWYEAENALTDGYAWTDWSDTTAASNWWFNPDKVLNKYSATHELRGFIEFEVYVPADMANAQINFRHGISSPLGSTLSVDGTDVGTFNMTYGNWVHPFGLEPGNAVAVGALSAGLHTIRLNHANTYRERGFDGILIYDGPNGDIVNGTENYGGPRYFTAPGSTVYPEIGNSVTPVITGTGSGTLKMYLNGAAYDGSPITTPGQYELKVIMQESSKKVTAMSGANFTIVPEPVTLSVMLMGAALLRRRVK